MKIPKKIIILGIPYKVKLVNSMTKTLKELDITEEEGDKQAIGYVLCKNSMILIDRKTSQETQESTFIHEILEVINDSLELNLVHRNISSLEASLYQVLKDNKLLRS